MNNHILPIQNTIIYDLLMKDNHIRFHILYLIYIFRNIYVSETDRTCLVSRKREENNVITLF